MKRGNTNVFKLSGNIALGGGNDYLSNDMGKGASYGASSSNTLKKTSTYGQSYENNNYEYDYSQKARTSENKKYPSRNQQQNGTGNYGSGMGHGNSSAKKIDYNYQNALNKLETDQLYNNNNNNRGGYSNNRDPSYRNSSAIKQNSYKDVYANNNNTTNANSYQQRSSTNNTRDAAKGSYKGYEQQGYTNSKQGGYGGSKITQQQQQPQDYYNQNQAYNQPGSIRQQPTRSTNNNTTSKQSYNNQPKPSKYDEQESYENSYSNNKVGSYQQKEEIKEYDPSTFVKCRQGCGRKFNPDSIAKHEKVCKKVFQNKRPEFNVQEQRLVAQQQKRLMKQGEIIEKKIEQKKKVEEKKQNIPKWKVQSLGFRAIIKANRRGGQMTQQEKRLIDQAQQAGKVKCQFCGRSFNENAAKRHIPFCETQQKKNAILKKKK